MKHEFKTTKTTKNVNNLLPATDEELGLLKVRSDHWNWNYKKNFSRQKRARRIEEI